MNSVKIVHTADLHLIPYDTINDKYKKEYAKNALLAFYSIIDFCKEYNADILLIAGDLFSSPVISEAFSKQVFSKFSEIPTTKVFISPGNHDFLSTSSSYKNVDLPENVYVFSKFSKIYLDNINTEIYGCGFEKRFHNETLLQNIEKSENIQICLIHGDIVSSTSEYNPITIKQISESNYDYIALGHIHLYSGIHKSGNTNYAYSGTHKGQGFDEKGKKGIIFGTVSKENTNLNFKELPGSSFEEVNIDITECENYVEFILSELNNRFGDNYKDNSYKIILTGVQNNNYLSMRKFICDNLNNYLFYAEIIDRTKPNIELLNDLAEETTIKGLFVKKILEILDSDDSYKKEIAIEALHIGLEVLNNDN